MIAFDHTKRKRPGRGEWREGGQIEGRRGFAGPGRLSERGKIGQRGQHKGRAGRGGQRNHPTGGWPSKAPAASKKLMCTSGGKKKPQTGRDVPWLGDPHPTAGVPRSQEGSDGLVEKPPAPAPQGDQVGVVKSVNGRLAARRKKKKPQFGPPRPKDGEVASTGTAYG